MLFIPTGTFDDDKLRPQILSVVPTANASLNIYKCINNLYK